MFTEALFMTAKMWRLLECPWTDEWIRRYGIHVNRTFVVVA